MTPSPSALARALGLLLVLSCALPTAASAAEIIVWREGGLTASERADVRAGAGVRLERRVELPHAELVSVPDGREQRALARLNADPDVRLAVPNVEVQVRAAPPAEVFGPLYVGTDGDVDGWEAWELGRAQGEGVTVGVVDMSIDASHPELVGQVDGEEDFVSKTSCDETAEPMGDADHGTHVAGLIAALRDDKGMVGLAPKARIKPLRALDNCGEGHIDAVLEAFRYAGVNGIPIVSASLATSPLAPADYKALVDAGISEVVKNQPDTLYVVAAGNEGNDNDRSPVYPCSNDADNIICVGMTDFEDKPVCWGNVGQESVDLFAPGLALNSTVRGNPRYTARSGTSQATSLVAAAAALLESQEPFSRTPETMKYDLMRTVDMFGGLEARSASGGRLNAARPLFSRPPETLLGRGAPGGTWTSCDPDNDGFRGADDLCPNDPGDTNGCPDRDEDGIAEPNDNCPDHANPDQLNSDGDGLGDACDSMLRGPDDDGDGKAFLDDRCPTLAAFTPDGCPLPEAPREGGGTTVPPVAPIAAPAPDRPRVLRIDVRVTPSSCKGRTTCRQAARVTVRVSRTAKVALKVERKVGRRWKPVTRRSLTASVRGRSVTVRGVRGRSLDRGSYRVTATVAGTGTRKRFKV